MQQSWHSNRDANRFHVFHRAPTNQKFQMAGSVPKALGCEKWVRTVWKDALGSVQKADISTISWPALTSWAFAPSQVLRLWVRLSAATMPCSVWIWVTMASRVQAADSGSGKGNKIYRTMIYYKQHIDNIGLMIRNEIHMKYELKTCCNDGSLIPHLREKMARRIHG